MKVLIRVDASVEIGSGHVMRCLTLADQFRKHDADVAFVCRDLPGALFEVLENNGYPYAKLPNDTLLEQESDAKETLAASITLFPDGLDVVIVDHYQLDLTWESIVGIVAKKIMVIDDLANRHHRCDLLLDQNYYRDLELRYQRLMPENCVKLLGPAYVLLRQEFADARAKLRSRDGSVKRILIFFGGSDATNQTKKALDAIRLLSRPDIEVDVVVGASNPHQKEILCICETMPNVKYQCQVSNMASLINAADFAIGAGGATTWERCILGLPTLTLVFADNQLQTTLDLEAFGAIMFLGWAERLTATELSHSILRVLEKPDLLLNLSEMSTQIMKGWQGAEFVVNAVRNILNTNQGITK